MKRMAMMLCLILALGWISDMGQLSLNINGERVSGIPVRVGYTYTINYGTWSTKLTPVPIRESINLGWEPIVVVNGKIQKLTRLGNGWLFNFTERESTNAGRLSNR